MKIISEEAAIGLIGSGNVVDGDGKLMEESWLEKRQKRSAGLKK